ncbi:MAG: alkaline phosphatase [Candidatus Tectimicrobiota bacterium]
MEQAHVNSRAVTRWNRRRFLAGAGAVLGGLAVMNYGARSSASAHKFVEYPFTLGVASGDPWPESVVLWTRLAPAPLQGGGMPEQAVPVQWQVATDEHLRHVVQQGSTLALPALAHAVHVEVHGLEPGRWYWYQFQAGAERSPIGRTRTAPRYGAPLEHLAFAFASCADWQNGLYAAYGAMAEEDLDLVVHLGDYIYEYGPLAGGPRQHDTPALFDLASYRHRHALYKTDRQLQAAHRAFPWVVVWDDHEVENNYASAQSEQREVDAQTFLQRRAHAYQAYYEHMPLRRRALPQGTDMQMYRRLRFGDLVEFNVLDTRQYRTTQPCHDVVSPRCPEAFEAAASMTGSAQEQWLYTGLRQTQARWKVLAQQTMLAQFDFVADSLLGPGVTAFNLDQWDGYVAARQRLLGFLRQQHLANLVVISGDIHASFVHDLKADFEAPESDTLGAEFVCTSITSAFPAEYVSAVHLAVPENPHTKFFDGVQHGYVRCLLNRRYWQSDYRVVPSVHGQVLVPEAPASTLASFVVLDEQPGVVSA